VAFRITTRRNDYTTVALRVCKIFLLLRAAEIAISRGRKGFIITVVADQSRIDQHCAAGSTSVQFSAYGIPSDGSSPLWPSHIARTVPGGDYGWTGEHAR
jgi:hypothetical protein